MNSYNNYNNEIQNYFTVKAQVVVLHGLAQANVVNRSRHFRGIRHLSDLGPTGMIAGI